MFGNYKHSLSLLFYSNAVDDDYGHVGIVSAHLDDGAVLPSSSHQSASTQATASHLLQVPGSRHVHDGQCTVGEPGDTAAG